MVVDLFAHFEQHKTVLGKAKIPMFCFPLKIVQCKHGQASSHNRRQIETGHWLRWRQSRFELADLNLFHILHIKHPLSVLDGERGEEL